MAPLAGGMDTGQLGKCIAHYQEMKKKFEDEVKKRKHTLDCMMKGEYPQWMIDLYDRAEPRDAPPLRKKMSSPLSAEAAMRHLKGIQDYEKVVEIVQEAFLNPLEAFRDNNEPLTDYMIERIEDF